MNDVQLRSDRGLAQPAVVITGGTEGIGRALAELFAKDGNNLLIVARDEAKLARTAAELTKAYPVIVKVTSQDLTTEEGRAGVEQALRRFGLYADILVNNAGMMSHGFFQDVDTATVHRLLDLDVRALVDLTHRFLPGMLARRRGGVLNVASMMGFMPVPYQAIYAASKAFVLSFSKALAYETMGTGVRVSVVAPGVVATKLHAKAGTQNSRYMYLVPQHAAGKGGADRLCPLQARLVGDRPGLGQLAEHDPDPRRAGLHAGAADGMVLQDARRRRQRAVAEPAAGARGDEARRRAGAARPRRLDGRTRR